MHAVSRRCYAAAAREARRFQAGPAEKWELRDDDRRIKRTFRFRNFREAVATANPRWLTVSANRPILRSR
jgi:pterin-4a-carbinolamine dehydratase